MTDCAACGSDRSRPTYGGLTHCDVCTHVWAEVAIDDERLRALIERHYFFGEEYTDYLADVPNARRNFERRLRTLLNSKHLPPSPQRLFEIGCAYGVFLDLARSWFSSVAGIDISADAVSYARQHYGLAAECGDLLDLDLAGPPFDAVCM